MRSSNKFAGYSYSLKRRRSSPFIRLGMLLAVAGAAMAGLSAWSGKQPDRGGAVGPLVLKPMQAHPVTQAHAATPLLRPSYVAGYVAQPLAESAPLSGRFQPAIPVRQAVLADPETTGSIAQGKTADLVLIDGDPSRSISALRQTRLVMMGGRIMDADKLRAAAGFSGRPK